MTNVKDVELYVAVSPNEDLKQEELARYTVILGDLEVTTCTCICYYYVRPLYLEVVCL